MKKKIIRKEFDITKNNDVMAKVWFEGSDSTCGDDAFVFLNGCEYINYRDIGDELEYTTKNKPFATLIIPEAFNNVYGAEKGWGKALKVGFDNFATTLKRIKNGEKNEMSEVEVKHFVQEQMDEKMLFVDYVEECLEKSKSSFAKELNSEKKLKKATRKYDPEVIINYLGNDLYREFSKSFRIAKKG